MNWYQVSGIFLIFVEKIKARQDAWLPIDDETTDFISAYFKLREIKYS
jgi:hypothetical protein